jgi:flavodoxin
MKPYKFKKIETALIIYWSKTGNTEKVAYAIKLGLEDADVHVTLKKPEDAENLDYFDYDLVCVGCPSRYWHPPEQITDFLKKKHNFYRENGKIKLGAPKVGGKKAVVFITYSGSHTGLAEATPAGKYVGQFFEQIGFNVVAEWYVLSEFHGSRERSTQGRLGDLRGKPTVEQLKAIKSNANQLVPKEPSTT